MSYHADLLAAARLLENAARLIDPAVSHLRAEARIADSYPTAVPGAAVPAPATNGTPTPGAVTSRGQRTTNVEHEPESVVKSELTPGADQINSYRPVIVTRTTDHVPVTNVEAAIIQRDRIGDEIEDIRARVRGITVMAHELSRQCRDALGIRAAKPTRCDPNGREGALEWGDFACQDAPVKGPICARCYMREYRWRKDHGKPARSEPGTDERVTHR